MADEIEGFFNVAFYISLRYLRHDCDELPMVMFDYFEDFKYSVKHDSYCCGIGKWALVRAGRLTSIGAWTSCLGDDGEADSHPLNDIFYEMLSWFVARYCLHDEAQKPLIKAQQRCRVDPNKELYEAMVAKLETHNALLGLLDEQLKAGWPLKDKIGDQLNPRKPRRAEQNGNEDGGSQEPSAKRVKNDERGNEGKTCRAVETQNVSRKGGKASGFRGRPVRTGGGQKPRTRRGLGSS